MFRITILAARRVLPPDLITPANASKPFMKLSGPEARAAARQPGVLFAQRRKIGARARSPLEQHALGLGQIENRFQRILHRVDEAGRALRARLALLQLHDVVAGFVVIEAVAARFVHADVEPDRRIEARLLGQHQVRQLVAEILRVFAVLK